MTRTVTEDRFFMGRNTIGRATIGKPYDTSSETPPTLARERLPHSRWTSDLNHDSMTSWIAELKAGNEDAAGRIWDECFSQLVAHARHRLENVPLRVFDEDDIVQSVFVSLCQGAAAGRFPKLNVRSDLWQILLMLTHQKVVDRIRKETTQKRGGGDLRGDSLFLEDPDRVGGFDQMAGAELTPHYMLELSENIQHLYAQLGSDSLRQVASLRLAGYSNREIAEQLGLTNRSVERKLQQIRGEWSEQLDPDTGTTPDGSSTQ